MDDIPSFGRDAGYLEEYVGLLIGTEHSTAPIHSWATLTMSHLAFKNEPTLISEEDLERQLILVRATAAHPLVGLFGPDSLTWRVEREAVLFLGAGRALLLQLAHPWIASAIADHSPSLTASRSAGLCPSI